MVHEVFVVYSDRGRSCWTRFVGTVGYARYSISISAVAVTQDSVGRNEELLAVDRPDSRHHVLSFLLYREAMGEGASMAFGDNGALALCCLPRAGGDTGR